MRYSTILPPVERNLARAETRAEFEVPSVAAWLKGLCRQGLGLALPALILKLDALSKADHLPPLQRVELLRLFKGPVLNALASLPKPVAAASDFVKSAATGVTLEQRLLRVMQGNYFQALHDLCKVEYGADQDCDDARSWATRNLLRFTERQIQYGIEWRVPWPPGTWQDLHDLFIFLSVRGLTGIMFPTRFDAGDADLPDEHCLDPTISYKRLLLLGLSSQFGSLNFDDPLLSKNLDAWAAKSRLDEPERRVWDRGLYLVEVAKDSPPRYQQGVLEDSFNGWVLDPALEFVAYIGRVLAPEVPDFRPFEWRRAGGQN